MASIFISYARRDGTALARRLCADLKTWRHDPWLDTERLGAGRLWSRELGDALDRCNVLIAILTPAAYDSSICYSEHLWALDQNKLVIPVLGDEATRRPVHLYSTQYLDLSESTYTANFARLLSRHPVRRLQCLRLARASREEAHWLKRGGPLFRVPVSGLVAAAG